MLGKEVHGHIFYHLTFSPLGTSVSLYSLCTLHSKSTTFHGRVQWRHKQSLDKEIVFGALNLWDYTLYVGLVLGTFWEHKHWGPMQQQMWHDRDPSLLKGRDAKGAEQRLKFCSPSLHRWRFHISKPFISYCNGLISLLYVFVYACIV